MKRGMKRSDKKAAHERFFMSNNIILKPRRSQVWIETVIYTLIGITIIGILLAVSKPKIDSMKDRLSIEQTIESLNNINDKIYEVQRAPGNKRVINLKISKGSFVIDPESDQIIWTIDSSYKYSEIDLAIDLGNINVKTTEANPYKVELWANYSVDITNNQKTDLKELSAAPSPYSLYIENMGTSDTGKINVDIVAK